MPITTETAPVAVGSLKQVRYCLEDTFGVAPGATGGSNGTPSMLRRVQSTMALQRGVFRSNEIQPDRQVHDARLGIKSVRGSLRAELTAVTYRSFFQQLVSGQFVNGAHITGDTVNVIAATTSHPAKIVSVLTPTPNNYITLGLKIGDVVRLTGFTGSAAGNNQVNLRVTGFTTTSAADDTILIGSPVPTAPAQQSVVEANETLTAVTGATGIAIDVTSWKLITPSVGSLIDTSFSIEHWYPDIEYSELFLGCRASRAQVNFTPGSIATVDFDLMGKDIETASGSPSSSYFTDPAAESTTEAITAMHGAIRIGGVDYGVVTGARVNITNGLQAESVIGAATTPYLFPGIQDISGEFSALFADESIMNHFLNEDEVDMELFFPLDDTLNPEFLNFYFPRIKITSSSKDDKPTSILGSYQFQALNQINGGTGTQWDATTMTIQDSVS